MATFERYFIRDEKLRKEQKNIYYQLIEKEEVLNRILEEFGLPTTGLAHHQRPHAGAAAERAEAGVL